MEENMHAAPGDAARTGEASTAETAQAARRFVAMPLEVYNAVSEFVARQPFSQVEALVAMLRRHAQVVEAATSRDGSSA